MDVDFKKVKELIDIVEKLQGFPSLKKIQAAASEKLKKMEEECGYKLPQTPANKPFPAEQIQPESNVVTDRSA